MAEWERGRGALEREREERFGERGERGEKRDREGELARSSLGALGVRVRGVASVGGEI